MKVRQAETLQDAVSIIDEFGGPERAARAGLTSDFLAQTFPNRECVATLWDNYVTAFEAAKECKKAFLRNVSLGLNKEDRAKGRI